MMVSQAEASPSQSQVFGVVSFYIVAAIVMVTVNKALLLSSPVPVFFLFCQLFVAVALLIASHFGRLISLPRWEWDIIPKLWPMISANVLGLVFNNLCLQYVDASFYQIARGLVLPITVAIAVTTRQGAPSHRAIACCGLITAGFGIGLLLDRNSTGNGTSSFFIGVLFGILSSFTTAIHSIIIKRSLPQVNDSAVHLAWYTNVLSSFAIIPIIVLTGEVPAVLEMFFDPSQLRTFFYGSLVTGVFGFLICVAGFLSIKVTSPVTHMVSSAARGVIQTMLSVWAFGDVISRSRAASIVIITTGSIAYVWVKHSEQQKTDSPLAGQEEPEDQVPLVAKEEV